MDFAASADHIVKLKESEQRHKYLDLPWGMKKMWNIKLTIIPIVIGALGTKGLILWLEDAWDHPNERTIKIGQNSVKSPKNLWRFAVIQSIEKNYQLTLVGKTRKEVNNNNNNWRKSDND